MNVHFIAIGGSAMHNLAIALHNKGYKVTGSDDDIFEPSKTSLAKYNLLPDSMGWDDRKITEKLDAIILGMHAREDNPELLRAKELGLKIFSYPEYLYEQSKNKTRVVVGGSHGKTTITAMIIHILAYHSIDCDYMVGAQLEGFETMVKLSEDTEFIILEGDEYLSSPIDLRPKFHLYQPHIAILTGIAWDHINVFPTFENYVDQFRIFIAKISKEGTLVYFEEDENLKMLASETNHLTLHPYNTHPHVIRNGKSFLASKDGEVPLKIFGQHNLQNIMGAKLVCNAIGVTDDWFYEAIQDFKGASKRLQLLEEKDETSVFLDFAHSPSKLKATTQAVKNQFPQRNLVACMELHTFSSLTEAFLKEYEGSMLAADEAIVYFNPETLKHKRLNELKAETVRASFGGNNLTIFTDSAKLQQGLLSRNWANCNLLLMSSGNFSGIDFKIFSKKLLEKL